MKRNLLLWLVVFFMTTGFAQTSTTDFQKETFPGTNGVSLPYRIKKPADASLTKKYPLVVFLHGAGERGVDNELHMNKNGVEAFLKGFTGDYSAIVVAPQCPKGDFWTNALSESNNTFHIAFGKEAPTKTMETLMALVKHWIASGLVDKDRVYIGGLSMGAFGTYELLWRMPSGTFASAFTICGATDTRQEKLESYATKTPLWIFHGRDDRTVDVGYSKDVYTKLQQIKGSVIKYTEYASVGHDSWTSAYANKSLIPWLFGYHNVETGCYKIASTTSNKALTKAGTGIALSDFEVSNAMHSWLITKATDHSYRIQAGDGANYFLSASGTSLALTTTANTQNQYWKLVQTKDGYYNIVSESNNYCLEMTTGGFVLKAKDNGTNQKFKIAHSRIFLVGDATPGAWNISNAQEMQAEVGKDALFTWSGYLWASEFKFQSTKLSSWESTYTALSTKTVPALGVEQKLVVHPQSQYDYKFKLNSPGFYKLMVNMANRSVTVTSEKGAKNLYMAGPAATGVWNANTVETMTPEVGKPGVFKWEGLMNAGEFKFILNKGSWGHSVNPTSGQSIISGNTYKINVTNGVSGDYKFYVGKSMYYTIIVDTENMQMTITEKTTGIPLYIVGAAVPASGWDNTKALTMTRLTDSTYMWTGDMKPDSFKFITKLGTWNSIIPAINNNEPIILEYTHNISDNYQGNYGFIIPYNGNYTIKVNLASNTMVVKKNTASSPLYLVGAAVPNVGWDNTKALSMDKVSDGIYTWTGDLKVDQFKFITQLGTWNSIFPSRLASEYIINGFVHEISNYYYGGDYKFIISEAGKYTITVNLINHTMVLKKTPVNSPIYIVGDAVPNVGWDNIRAPKMNPVSSEVYEWTGYLNQGPFKFITQLGTWVSIIPDGLAHEPIVIGNTHKISNNYRGDYRYVMPKSGNYKMTLNTRERTLKVETALGLRSLSMDDTDASGNKFAVIPLSGSVKE